MCLFRGQATKSRNSISTESQQSRIRRRAEFRGFVACPRISPIAVGGCSSPSIMAQIVARPLTPGGLPAAQSSLATGCLPSPHAPSAPSPTDRTPAPGSWPWIPTVKSLLRRGPDCSAGFTAALALPVGSSPAIPTAYPRAHFRARGWRVAPAVPEIGGRCLSYNDCICALSFRGFSPCSPGPRWLPPRRRPPPRPGRPRSIRPPSRLMSGTCSFGARPSW
jgi:hypothetical protein